MILNKTNSSTQATGMDMWANGRNHLRAPDAGKRCPFIECRKLFGQPTGAQRVRIAVQRYDVMRPF
ncbi:MAG: hypothetical protein R2873_31380 [Caldilineaceae bacterium]